MKLKNKTLLKYVFFPSLLLSSLTFQNTPLKAQSLNLPLSEITELAREAYIYGYAPVAVAKQQYDQTNITANPAYAPLNQLAISPDIPYISFITPNANTLYSSAHLDLSQQPVILSTPSIQDRYFSWQIMDAYTNAFSYIGSRATGGVEGIYALVGPNWTGTLPSGYTTITSPTNSVWIIGRHEANYTNQADIDKAISLVQDSILLPLSDYETKPADYKNPFITKTTPEIPQLDIEGLNFFEVFNDWITDNPPPSEDQPTLNDIAQIGLGPGFNTDFTSLPEPEKAALLAGINEADAIIQYEGKQTGLVINGWSYNLDIGVYGTDYLLRSIVARDGLAANIVQESLYNTKIFDQYGQFLRGDNQYTMTLTASQLPVPVKEHGFWSLTPYNAQTLKLIEGPPLGRYTLGSQNINDFVYNADGSLTFYLQKDSPGGALENNWLPITQNNEPFYLAWRSYYPDWQIICPTQEACEDPNYDFSQPPAYILPELVNNRPAPASTPESASVVAILGLGMLGLRSLLSKKIF